MTAVKKIHFYHQATLSSILITSIFILGLLLSLGTVSPVDKETSLFPYLLLPYFLLAALSFQAFYKGIYIEESFLQECKKKEVADPKGIYHVTIMSSIGPMSDDESSKSRKFQDELHLYLMVFSLFLGAILFVLLQLEHTSKGPHIMSLMFLIGLLTAYIVTYYEGQTIPIE